MSPTNSAGRPTFTQSQLYQYFNLISIPAAYHYTAEAIQLKDKSTQISFLNTLLRYQLVSVPFENLDLHYSPVKGISLSLPFLYDKIVTRASGRGGYCMQNNLFFATILRSLGFEVTSHGGRVSKQVENVTEATELEEVEYGGYGHQINILTFNDGSKYFCDVGFGASGPTFLVPLRESFTEMNTGTKDRIATTMRLTRGWTANNTVRTPETKQWIYSVKFSAADDKSKPWIQCYCFSESEFFPRDFEMMSWYVSTSRTSMFVNNVLAQKFIMSEDGESLIGDVTLFGTGIKERRLGESKTLMEIKSEKDRIEALKLYLGINLKDDEQVGILGFPTMVR